MPLQYRSIVGRRLGLTSTGGIGGYIGSTGNNSTAVTQLAQMWGAALFEAVNSTVGSTLKNYGISTLSSATSTAISFEIAAPVKGVLKEIFVESSASELTFGSCTTDIVFRPATAGAGSTAFFSAANLAGTNLVLRGKSTAEWAVIGSTANLTIG